MFVGMNLLVQNHNDHSTVRATYSMHRRENLRIRSTDVAKEPEIILYITPTVFFSMHHIVELVHVTCQFSGRKVCNM